MTCRLESSALFEMQREEELCQDDILSLEPQVRMVIKWVKKTQSITLAAQRRNPPQDQAWISLLNAFSRYQKFYCGLCSAYSSWPPDWLQQIQQVTVSQNRFYFLNKLVGIFHTMHNYLMNANNQCLEFFMCLKNHLIHFLCRLDCPNVLCHIDMTRLNTCVF